MWNLFKSNLSQQSTRSRRYYHVDFLEPASSDSYLLSSERSSVEHDTTHTVHIPSVKWLNPALGNCPRIESTDLRQGRVVLRSKNLPTRRFSQDLRQERAVSVSLAPSKDLPEG